MSFNAEEFILKLVSFPSISAQKEYGEGTRLCAEFLVKSLRDLGFSTDLVETDLHPIVWAERKAISNAKIRILCYGHYDVQPVDPLDKWDTDPFKGVVKDGRIYGRGTADNKGPFTCILAGVIDFLKSEPNAPIDFAFMFEGEEEISSPSMEKFLRDKKEILSKYDLIVLSDTMSPSEQQIVITSGLRGVLSFDAKFIGPNTDLHSGIFGGGIYNPIQAMTEVCESLHNRDGLVNIEKFYDEVLPVYGWEKEEIKKFPISDDEMKMSLGVEELYKQKGVKATEATRLLPTIEFTGIGGGYQGTGNKSVIPSECFVKISCRIVPNQDGDKIRELVQGAIRERCPRGVKVSFKNHDGLGNAYCIIPPKREGAMNPYPKKLEEVFEGMEDSIEENFGSKPIYLREGGSIPLISLIKDILGLDCVMMGLFTPRDNLHAPNESFSLSMMDKAIKTYKRLFERLAR